MLQLERRAAASHCAMLVAPFAAVAFTLVVTSLLVAWAGAPVGRAYALLLEGGFGSRFAWSETLTRAVPLILTGLSVAVAFRARLYNIGAEGQLIVGALCGGGVAIACHDLQGGWILPAMLLAGAAGGALWGGLAAWLKTQFRAEETLTTLMLTYVAGFVLAWLVNGPWRDPDGMNFPQSVMFADPALFAPLFDGYRVTAALLITLAVVLFFALYFRRSFLAYQLEVAGQAPAAARFAGFSARGGVWLSLLLSGMTAGVAGVAEVAGPVGQLNLNISPGYGFAAIIVAYLGRLSPLGMVLSGLLMALVYLGGEAAQVSLQLPAAITGLFQGMLLLFLLGANAFVDNRLRRRVAVPA